MAPVAIALLVSSAAVTAQQPKKALPKPAYWNSPQPYEVRGEENGRLMKMFFSCVYGSSPSEIDAYLKSSDISGALPAKSVKLEQVTKRCGNRMGVATMQQLHARIPGAVYRSFMAEQAYLAKQSTPAVLPAGAIEFLRQAPKADGLPLVHALVSTADCLSFRDTRGADALLRTVPGSKEEQVAARALVPALSQCIAADEKFSMTAQTIRSFAADGLWARYAQTEH